MAKSYQIYCPRCEALGINGIACHERGCPNSDEKWVKRGRGDNRHLIPENEETPVHLLPERQYQEVLRQRRIVDSVKHTLTQ